MRGGRVAARRHGVIVTMSLSRCHWRGAAEHRRIIAAAGAVPPLVALLVSPAIKVQEASAGALGNLAVANGARAGLVLYER